MFQKLTAQITTEIMWLIIAIKEHTLKKDIEDLTELEGQLIDQAAPGSG